jgi:torulene dioxygenase
MDKILSDPTSFASGSLHDINPVALGLYGSAETREPTMLDIEGTIPGWMNGSLYRGAATTWDVGDYTAEHWFDGFSRNHRFEINNGTVSYRRRNGSDELMDFVRETGKYPGSTFGSDPCKAIFGAFEATYRDGSSNRRDSSSGTIGISYAPNFAGLAGNATDDGAPFDVLVSTTDANELFTYEASDKNLINGGSSAAHPVVGEDGSMSN